MQFVLDISLKKRNIRLAFSRIILENLKKMLQRSFSRQMLLSLCNAVCSLIPLCRIVSILNVTETLSYDS